MQRACPLILLSLFALVSQVAYAGPGPVAVVCVEPRSRGEAHRKATGAALALRAELARRGRRVVDPTMALFSAAAPPAELVGRARRGVKAAVEEYDSLEFGKATAGLTEALGLLREAMQQDPGSVKVGEFIMALHYLGASAFYDGNQKQATRHFGDAIAFSPESQIDDGIFPPDLVKAFRVVRDGMEPGASLAVSGGSGAEVYLDGKPVGAAPVKLGGLMPGSHLVRVQAPGYVPTSRWVKLKSGGTARVGAQMAEGDQLAAFTRAAASGRAELARSRPGRGVGVLARLLGVDSLVLVVAPAGGKVQATWAEGGFWIKRYQAAVGEGREPLFAAHFMDRGASVGEGGPECRRDAECGAKRACSDGRCVGPGGGAPVYKKWWFWTIIGAVVVGGTVGAVVGTMPDKWTASVQRGSWP